MTNYITIYSSQGELRAYPQSGKVFYAEVDMDIDDATIGDIERFDFKEWKAFYDEPIRDVDILDVGYWTRDGKYEPPEPDYRDEIRKARQCKNT